jgi:nucleoside-diphosphate-sugar epimerase
MATSGRLFLTGATGLVGQKLIPFLRENRPERSVVALVRHSRQADLLKSQGIDAVLGDLSQPLLGIAPDEYSELCDSLTEILHVAADLRFDVPVEQCRLVNVVGVRGVLDLARSSPQLQKLGHVSTTYVNGCREGVFEEEPMPPVQEFVNGYQQSKFEAEQLVLEAMEDIPVSIYRLPVLLADSADGQISQFGYFHHLLRMLPDSVLPAIPGDPNLAVDLVPADWVAASLAHIFDFRFTRGAIRHLCAGAQGSLRLSEVAEIICRTMEQHPSYPPGRSVRLPRLVSCAEFNEIVKDSKGSLRRVVIQLGHNVRLMGIRQEYSNTKAQADLQGSGLALPEMRSFLENAINYCLDTEWGRKSRPMAAHATDASN